MKAFPIIVSSPSGAGKTTIVDAVLKRDKTVARVVTASGFQTQFYVLGVIVAAQNALFKLF